MSKLWAKKVAGSILIVGALFVTIATAVPQMFSTGCSRARALTEQEQQMVDVDNAFGFKLFNQICEGEDGNVFISPLSVSMVLGMALNGADGDTKQAILDTLGMSGLTDEEINQAYQGLIQTLQSLDKEVILELANSVWHKEEWQIKQDFIDTNQTYFDAEVSEIDFDDPAAPATVNDWVNQKTNGKIDSIIDEFPALTAASLINAIYFEGVWQSQFKPENTYNSVFKLADRSEVPCRMMYQKGDFKYAYNEYFQAMDLPYGNGKYSMTILLPHEEDDVYAQHDDINWGVDDIVANLTAKNWATWTGELQKIEKAIYLPRFSLEYDLKMKDVLTALGMGIAFDDGGLADFTRMTDVGLGVYIDDVIHKTFLEVDERGTRAAAITLTNWVGRGESAVMKVDRPFVLVIREQHTGSILFLGKIMEPDFGL